MGSFSLKLLDPNFVRQSYRTIYTARDSDDRFIQSLEGSWVYGGFGAL
jgi:hypothetical protein